MSEGIVLLRTLFLSTSQRNAFRYSKDKKKRGRIVGNTIGLAVLHLLLMGFGILMCFGYGTVGIIDSAPTMCALTIGALSFVLTLFKTNGYLFNFKEYDMLMSLPFSSRTVAACKFLYMYAKSLPWYLNISLAMMVGYGIYAQPPVVVFPLWIVLSLALPIIPMLAASFLGFLVAKVSSGFRRANIVQTLLSFVAVLAFFSLRFVLEGVLRNNGVQVVLEQVSAATNDAAGVYLPARWFANAITKTSPADSALLIGVSLVLFAVVFLVVGRSYRRINSSLRSHASTGQYHMSSQRKHSAVVAIAFKEFKRMTGSSVYMVNGAMGEVLATLLGVGTLVIGFDRIIAMATQGAPIDTTMLHPAIPLIVHFFIGMVATTACSPSLEGKNYWILQSLPIEQKTIYQGKMLFNMCLTVPFMAISTLCLCVSARVPALDTVLYLVLGLALCSFSTAWGCVCGIKHMRLDWENEVEVIKQGAAVAIYMLPNMFVVMGLAVLVVFLGTQMDHNLVTIALTLVATVLATLSYMAVLRIAKRGTGK